MGSCISRPPDGAHIHLTSERGPRLSWDKQETKNSPHPSCPPPPFPSPAEKDGEDSTPQPPQVKEHVQHVNSLPPLSVGRPTSPAVTPATSPGPGVKTFPPYPPLPGVQQLQQSPSLTATEEEDVGVVGGGDGVRCGSDSGHRGSGDHSERKDSQNGWVQADKTVSSIADADDSNNIVRNKKHKKKKKSKFRKGRAKESVLLYV